MKPKNILLITSDQQHWNTLGSLNSEVPTPNLDRLAAQSSCFTRAYTCNPTCTPARASMITGLYPSQHGAYSLGTKLPENVPTLGQYFQEAGFRTDLIGKAHFQQVADHPLYPSIESNPKQQDLEFWRSFRDPFYGFKHVELCRNHADEMHVGQHYGLWLMENGLPDYPKYFQPLRSDDRSRRVWELPEPLHYNHWIAERTCERLALHASQSAPFFLWASFPDPHPPYLAPEPWASLVDPATVSVPTIHEGEHARNPRHFSLTQEPNPDYSDYEEPEGNNLHGCHSHLPLNGRQNLAADIAVYYGMVAFVDHCVGRILDQLDALGLTDDTLVVFTTDHGHLFGQHGLAAKGPFLYEDLVRVPLLVCLPGMIEAGKKSDALQSLVDLAPTFLSACGLPVPRHMTGIDQWKVWTSEKSSVRDHVIVENRHNPYLLNQRSYINRDYKLTLYCAQDEGELFNLREDPEEVHNLWDDPAAARMKSELLLRYAQAELSKEPLPMPRVSTA